MMVRPTRFEITEEPGKESWILSIAGELDLSTSPVLAQRVEERLDEDHKTLTLDLSALTFMDSSGLRLLIELNQRSTRETWNLTLKYPVHESALTVLQLTGADKALPFEGSLS
jgi:anti-sigma B factor antagonist